MKFFSKAAPWSKWGPALIIFAAVLWALDGILRRSLFALPPVTIVFYEHLIGSLILVPLVAHKLLALKVTVRLIVLTVFVAFLSGLMGTLWFTTALVKVNFIPFSVVFLLQKLQPLFAIGTARLLLKEKITKGFGVLAAVALIAAYFVTFPNGVVNFATGAETVTAALYALAAAFAWGTTTVFSKLLIKEAGDQTTATGLRFFTTTIFSLALVVILGATASLQVIEGSQLLRLTIIALSTGMVALWIYYTGLRYTQAKIATLLELTFPLLAVGIDALLYKTVLAPSQYLAAAILIFAMFKLARLQLRLKSQTAKAETKLS